MDYNSFLKRDYKSLGEPLAVKPGIRWSRLHVLLVLAAVTVVGTLLTLASHDAAATREPVVRAFPHLSTGAEPRNRTTQFSPTPTGASSTRPGSVPAVRVTLPLHVPSQPAKSAQLPTATTPNEDFQLHEVKVKRGDTLSAIFSRLRLSHTDLHNIMALKNETRELKRLVPGQAFRLWLHDGEVQELEYVKDQLHSLKVSRIPDGFEAQQITRSTDRRVAFSEGEIQSSLFEAAMASGLSNSLTMELASVFGWDIDFVLDMRRGDHFRVIFEEQYLDGKKVGEGPILAAEFINQGKTYQAVRYVDSKGRGDYFTPTGMSMRKAFIRTPVDFTRIASRFGKRKHPVLNRMRVHKGVDYAARTGTPIKASGDGKVVYRGRKGGYGRTVIVQHGGRYSTLYAHMSSYRRKVRVGSRVKQGQIIGYVGQSGLATGPHLHYEFRVNGVHRNPLTVRLPNAQPIATQFKADFLAHAERMMTQLKIRDDQTQIASAN